MQQTDYSLVKYVIGSISGNYNVLHSISNYKPIAKAVVTFVLSFIASIFALILSLYLQFKLTLDMDLVALGFPEEASNMLITDFSTFLDVQLVSLLLFLGLAVLVWIGFALISFLMAKLVRGQGKFTEVLLFNLFLFVLMPVFVFFGSLLFLSKEISIYPSFFATVILTLVCLRAEYKGIKHLHSLTSSRAFLSLLLSIVILSAVGGFFLF